MNEHEAGLLRGPYRTRAEADELVTEYLAGGLSREQFCRGKDLPVKTLERYVTRYRRQRSGSGAQVEGGVKAAGAGEGPRFVAVEVAGQDAGGRTLAVLLTGGRRVEVGRGFDEETLRRLVAALERH